MHIKWVSTESRRKSRLDSKGYLHLSGINPLPTPNQTVVLLTPDPLVEFATFPGAEMNRPKDW
jgi:hypothetical protein